MGKNEEPTGHEKPIGHEPVNDETRLSFSFSEERDGNKRADLLSHPTSAAAVFRCYRT